jgi:hypothetical protein
MKTQGWRFSVPKKLGEAHRQICGRMFLFMRLTELEAIDIAN